VVRIGITGHSNLTDSTAELVAEELRKILADQPDRLTGVTCAEAVVDRADRGAAA
jgi:hypothetical protein